MANNPPKSKKFKRRRKKIATVMRTTTIRMKKMPSTSVLRKMKIQNLSCSLPHSVHLMRQIYMKTRKTKCMRLG